MVVVKEARARGVFVKTLIAAVALIDMTAVCVFAVVAALLRADQSLSPGAVTVALGTAGRELGAAIFVRPGLVIPATEEAHYLKIVAAFSAGIVSNPTMRYQLYQSPSAAHAHKILNRRGDIDFNCFLDETLIASSPPPPTQGNATPSL